MGEKKSIRLGRRTVEMTNPDKALFPDAGITKMDLVDYHRRIAEHMLPHLRDRPLSLHRFPDGIDEDGFYQKESSDHFPDWVKTKSVTKEGGTVNHVICNGVATLVFLVGQAVITPHIWLSRQDRIHQPDQIILDLDPSSDDFDPVRKAARAVRGVIDELGLTSYPKLTGSRGVHVMIPLRRGPDFDQVREFAKGIAEVVKRREPDLTTTEMRKDKRGDRVFVDYLRNAYAQTVVPPYAVRAKPGAPVSTPIDWEELGDSELTPRSFTVENIFRRLSQRDDPWKGHRRRASSLPWKDLDRLRSDQ